jgi:hypothetical protein
MEINSDEFTSGGLREKHAIATWNLRTNLAFPWRRKTTKKTCVKMTGPSQQTDKQKYMGDSPTCMLLFFL